MNEMKLDPPIAPVASESVKGFAISPALTVAASIMVLGVLFFRFIWQYSTDVLFWDQWGFLAPFFQGRAGLRQLFFEQWGPHREGVGLIADKFLYPLTEWNTRAESLMIGGSIFLAMLVALVLKCKLFGSLSHFDIAIPFMFLTLVQWEVMVGTPNPAHSAFPLLMIMLYCVALLQRNRLLRYASVLLLNILLIYTGFGVFMGVVTLGVFVLEFYWSARRITQGHPLVPIFAILIAAASLGSFFVHYTFWPAVDCFVFPYRPISSYVTFMALMVWGFVGPGVLLRVGTGVGLVILAAVGIAFWDQLRRLLTADRPAARILVGSVLLGYSLLFIVNTAVGRVCLGSKVALSSRYATLLIPAFLGLYFYLLSFSAKRAGKLSICLFVLLLIPSALAVRNSARSVTNGKRAWAACYRQTENIPYCDTSSGFKVDPSPEQNHLKEKLDYLKQHRLNLFAQSNSR
jgi:hypothetical protein